MNRKTHIPRTGRDTVKGKQTEEVGERQEDEEWRPRKETPSHKEKLAEECREGKRTGRQTGGVRPRAPPLPGSGPLLLVASAEPWLMV